MTDRETLKLALVALEDRTSLFKWQTARDAVREALAQPAQHREGHWCVDLTCSKCYSADFRFKHATPPATQRPWVGLTAEEIHDTEGYKETREMYRFAHAIEAKLKEKNT